MGFSITGHGRNVGHLNNCLKNIKQQLALVNELDTQSQAQINTLTRIKNNPPSHVARQAAALGIEVQSAIQELAQYRTILQGVKGEVNEAKLVVEGMKDNYKLPRHQRIGQSSGDEIVQGAAAEMVNNLVPVAAVEGGYVGLMNKNLEMLAKYGIDPNRL